ncbi:hypothetical protein AB0J30_38940 [Streptomyces microflavus]|uniref:hypothetical protein n=1 Tax=Streptomyces microflavus TaxID=1919 RepID=UPI003445824E
MTIPESGPSSSAGKGRRSIRSLISLGMSRVIGQYISAEAQAAVERQFRDPIREPEQYVAEADRLLRSTVP